VTSLVVERLAEEPSARDARALQWGSDYALDVLAGRTVWSTSGLGTGRRHGRELRSRLGWATDAGVGAGALEVSGNERLRRLGEHLETMLAGRGPLEALDPDADDVCDEAVRDAAGLAEDQVAADDLVVLNDPVTALLADAMRERGAHTIVAVRAPSSAGERAVREAMDFLRRHAARADAFVVSWREYPGGRRVECLAAVMPVADTVAAKAFPATGSRTQRPRDVGWGSLLADLVVDDRREHVGGRRHVRPFVAAR
jgi:hypothetical protein